MKSAIAQTSFRFQLLIPNPPDIPRFSSPSLASLNPNLSLTIRPNRTSIKPLVAKSKKEQTPNPRNTTQDDGIPIDFKSRHNYIRVLEVLRKVDHEFVGAKLLLLDGPSNIHNISFIFKSFTDIYFDVFATLPPILPPGPLGILGFGAGSTAKLILELYPNRVSKRGQEAKESTYIKCHMDLEQDEEKARRQHTRNQQERSMAAPNTSRPCLVCTKHGQAVLCAGGCAEPPKIQPKARPDRVSKHGRASCLFSMRF